ncbi:MAG: hypothetical protein AAF766_22255 [Cyanobacteria bacterium P01_D01_bin.14]
MFKILPPYLLTAGILTPPFIMASTSATEPEQRTAKQHEPPLNGYQTRRLTALAPQPGPVITVEEFLYSWVSALLAHTPTITDPAPTRSPPAALPYGPDKPQPISGT